MEERRSAIIDGKEKLKQKVKIILIFKIAVLVFI